MSDYKLKSNERSEGGEIIVEMNMLFHNNDWIMKSAVGELSLHSKIFDDDRNKTLFPDAIIFSDKDRNETLMGWEFKMPDVHIDDQELYSNALDKANRMGTQAFVLWNFQYASIYIKEDKGWPLSPTKFFDSYAHILTDRNSVNLNSNVWKEQLYIVLEYLNQEIIADKFESAPIEFNISSYVTTIADKLAPSLSGYYLDSNDTMLRSFMTRWRTKEQAELNDVSKNEPHEVIANAYARNVIIRWINRLIFCHLLKKKQNKVNNMLVQFSRSSDIKSFSEQLNEIVNTTDFYTILHVDKYEDDLPQRVVNNLNEFNVYLANSDFSTANDSFISKLLENIIDTTVRELMGLYTTPRALSKILVGLTVIKTEGEFADVTTGSGTIANEIQNLLKGYGKSNTYIHDHVWASDRYGYPLQIANLNMTSSDSLNLKNIVFQKNTLNMKSGEIVKIVNPSTGELEEIKLPKFDYIISNLPFISSNSRNEEDQKYISNIIEFYDDLNDKIDLYQAIIIHLNTLISDNEDARIGVVISNSWTKVQKGYKSFFKTISKIYNVEMIVVPSSGRWFQNASVMTNIIVLKKKVDSEDSSTRFISLDNRVTSEYSNIDEINDLIIDLKLNEPNPLYNQQSLKKSQIIERLNKGLSIESLFDDTQWLNNFNGKLTPLSNFLEGGRGTRTGGDPIFIMNDKKVNTENLVPYLKTIKNVTSYEVSHTEYYYFYTKYTLEEIRKNNMKKTLDYLEEIKNSKTAMSRKSKLGEKWFNADQSPQYADFITSINPQDRYFWSLMKPQMAVNQRVTAFRVKPMFLKDIDVLHAILNSILAQYMLAGSGFGRGQGATDLTKEGIIQIHIPNIELLSNKQKDQLLTLWGKLKTKKITTVFEQVKDTDWITFNKLVLNFFGVNEEIYQPMATSLVTLIKRRISAKK
ncbi:MAG: N-6 DNA methylase [Staphylococcus equorum]